VNAIRLNAQEHAVVWGNHVPERIIHTILWSRAPIPGHEPCKQARQRLAANLPRGSDRNAQQFFRVGAPLARRRD
jgi:hypothetical protein